MSRAALFPGQGAQFPGMGKELAARFPEARALFEKADAVLGFPLVHTLFEGSEEEVGRTDICQPGIFLVSAATMAAAEAKRGLGRGAFSCAAGLSLGEYTALWFAGALAFEDGLRLTRARGRAMQEASDAVPSGMAAVLGLDPAGCEEACARARALGPVVVANLNSPGQVVISGARAALEKAGEEARALGAKRVLPLKVAGAFHSPVMEPAAAVLRAELGKVAIRDAAIPVYANCSATPLTAAADLRDALARQVTAPVLFQKTLEAMAAAGVTAAVEPAPGKVLAGFAKKAAPGIAVEGLDTADALGGTGS
ncbi:MAG TPA: ACP S-malonyltransferase [Planctomycetota bacterium]|nr:ACP S-malonyltransferase [Planctomycetota bacterium]